jgi:hypothetical protein
MSIIKGGRTSLCLKFGFGMKRETDVKKRRRLFQQTFFVILSDLFFVGDYLLTVSF